MPRLTFDISADGLRATARVAKGPPMEPAAVEAAIAATHLTHGLDAAVIAQLTEQLGDAEGAGEYEVARGTAPVAGVDGRLDVMFPPPAAAGELCSDGHIDYHERHLLHPIADGTTIATVIAPTAGTPGRDVRGRVLPARPGAPVKVRLGPGARLEGEAVVATRGGALLRGDKGIDVVPLFEHRGDVDLRSGNLHTEGSLSINGDVREGFVAEATGNIVVRGAVLSAQLTAGGDVAIDQGAMGATCVVQAGGDLTCRHATAARLEAGRTATIGDQLAHCRVYAERIVMRSGRGQAFGGELHAQQAIEMNAAGTAEGAATLLAVAGLLDERKELAQLASEAARVSRAAQRPTNGRAGSTKGTRAAVRAGDRTEAERLRLRLRQRELLASAHVAVHGPVHPGVRVQLGDLVVRIDRARAPTRFVYDGENHRILEEKL